MTFEEVMAVTAPVGHIDVFKPHECQAMYETLCTLSDGSIIIEVGSDYGRSSSVILQVAAMKNFLSIHVDPWEEFRDRAKQWMEVMAERCPWHPFIVLHMTTEAAAIHIQRLTPNGMDCAFIDGCHDPVIVTLDLQIVASRVKPGGFLLAHDYPSAGVTEPMDAFVAEGRWTKYLQAGGLGIWKRQ